MSLETAACSTHSAGQPVEGTHLPLSQLNKASAKAGGSWVVDANYPAEDTYDYTWQGKTRCGTNFVVTLVSTEDPTQYCQAQFKKNLEDRDQIRGSKEGNKTWHALRHAPGWFR